VGGGLGGVLGGGGGDQHTWHFNIEDKPKGIHIFVQCIRRLL